MWFFSKKERKQDKTTQPSKPDNSLSALMKQAISQHTEVNFSEAEKVPNPCDMQNAADKRIR